MPPAAPRPPGKPAPGKLPAGPRLFFVTAGLEAGRLALLVGAGGLAGRRRDSSSAQVVQLLVQLGVDPGGFGQVALDLGHRPEQGLLAVIGLGPGRGRSLIPVGATQLESVGLQTAQGEDTGQHRRTENL